AEDGIRDGHVTGVKTCALPIFFIFTSSAFMKEAANSLLKVLEEPPEFATIFLLTENPGELLPTLRSRSMTVSLAALSAEQIESRSEERRVGKECRYGMWRGVLR